MRLRTARPQAHFFISTGQAPGGLSPLLRAVPFKDRSTEGAPERTPQPGIKLRLPKKKFLVYNGRALVFHGA